MNDRGSEPLDERYVDLHAHSTASDGAVSPAELVEAACRAKLQAIAITDHDTIAGNDEAFATGASLGIRVVRGCELSAYDRDFEVHLLALHIRHSEAIRPSLEGFQRERVDRGYAIVERLSIAGVPVNIEDVLAEAAGGALGRPHIARAMIRAGHVADHRDAFDRYLGAGKPAYVPKPRLDVADAIGLAHSAGALAVWAHPGRDGTRERLVRLAALGLDGVEVRHPGHTPGDTQRLGRLAEELDLVPSGGSDWHGATEGYRTLGNMHVPESWLDMQDVRLATRVS
ncbi:MAG TPA: PHP domain-containing protein [Gemmatimonadaceae bacterium]|nr:PHP domain-containing protein [Gemmatimonadaceae bacterium]